MSGTTHLSFKLNVREADDRAGLGGVCHCISPWHKKCDLEMAPKSLTITIKLICSWSFCSWNSTNSEVPDQAKFFDRLGERVRNLRKARGLSQEDMISFGFSARHWQQIEAGRPITVTTLLRICGVFHVPVARLLQGLDKGIY